MAVYFDIQNDAQALSPVVVSVPHAGIDTADLSAPLQPGLDLRCDADLYVDRLYDGLAPGAFIVARLSRFVCDLNRHPDDIPAHVVPEHLAPHPMSARGFVWQTTTTGMLALRRPLTLAEWQARRSVHQAYHGAIAQAIDRARQRFGFAILIDGHSMPSTGRSGPAGHPDAGQRRADVVPGDRDGESCGSWLTKQVVELFREDGFSVDPNNPYRGGFITAHHGQPQSGVHALQIELRRDIYMDETNYTINDHGMTRLRESLARLMKVLHQIRPEDNGGAV